MKKLTQDQKQYRKRKKEAKKDFVRVRQDNGEIALRVAKRPLCMRVSEEVFNALAVIAEAYGKGKGEMISFMTVNSIHKLQMLPGPKYTYRLDGTRERHPRTERLIGLASMEQVQRSRSIYGFPVPHGRNSMTSALKTKRLDIPRRGW